MLALTAAARCLRQEVEALTAPKTLKIGMHIRVGDRALVKGQDSSRLDFYAAFFDCAAQLERHRGAKGRTVKYFLLRWVLRFTNVGLRVSGQMERRRGAMGRTVEYFLPRWAPGFRPL